jgi:ComF family protein
MERPPRHAGIFAAVAYDDVSRGLALRLKHGGRIALAETAGRLMIRHLPRDATLLVPVPLHRSRLWSRGYNQAALIAGAIARHTGVPHRSDLLRRRRATPLLRGLGAREREAAVRGVFCVDDQRSLAGERIVLVDDVHTSGATSRACVAALARAGAASVTILVWARVLDDAVD